MRLALRVVLRSLVAADETGRAARGTTDRLTAGLASRAGVRGDCLAGRDLRRVDGVFRLLDGGSETIGERGEGRALLLLVLVLGLGLVSLLRLGETLLGLAHPLGLLLLGIGRRELLADEGEGGVVAGLLFTLGRREDPAQRVVRVLALLVLLGGVVPVALTVHVTYFTERADTLARQARIQEHVL